MLKDPAEVLTAVGSQSNTFFLQSTYMAKPSIGLRLLSYPWSGAAVVRPHSTQSIVSQSLKLVLILANASRAKFFDRSFKIHSSIGRVHPGRLIGSTRSSN